MTRSKILFFVTVLALFGSCARDSDMKPPIVTHSRLISSPTSVPTRESITPSWQSTQALRQNTSTPLPSPDTEPTATPTILLLATPTLVPLVNPLPELPLNVGNYWEYSSKVYSGIHSPEIITTTFTITDRIESVQTSQGYSTTKLHREIQSTSSSSLDSFIGKLQPKDYWYIVSGNFVYQQITKLDLSQVESSWLEYVFPLSEKPCWFPNPTDRNNLTPDLCTRWVEGPFEINIPAGNFDDCYEIWTTYQSGATLSWFCSGVGVVKAKYDHHGTPFGYEEILIDFLIIDP